MPKNNLIPTAIAVLIVAGAIFSASYLTLTGFAIQSENFIEKTIQIEVWANSYIEIEAQGEFVLAKVYLDNGTLLKEQELESYINNLQLDSQDKSLFNLSEASPGTHTLKVLSQGSPAQYVNPSSLEKQIEIKENREIIILETQIEEPKEEFTEEIPEETIPDFEFKGTCLEFSEQVLWSSDYSNDIQGSTNYQTWQPKYNCSELGVLECFIGSLELETRFLSFEESNRQSQGFIQISNPSNEICNNLKQGIYEKYLAYETLRGESQKRGKYCGNNKNPNSRCGIEITDNYSGNSCYGIKSYADRYFLVDAFTVKYTLCSGEVRIQEVENEH